MDTDKRRRLFRHQADKGGLLAWAGHQRFQLLHALQVVRGLLVRRHRLLVAIGFVDVKPRWNMLILQYVEAQVARLFDSPQ